MRENSLDDLPEPAPPSMTAGQKKFLAVLGGILLLMLAIGGWYLYELGAFSGRPHYDRTWAYCNSGDRCTAIPAPCDEWVAINNKNVDEASKYYDYTINLVEQSPQMECTNPPYSSMQPRAYCLSGLCTIK
jgi:hypothetical protein